VDLRGRHHVPANDFYEWVEQRTALADPVRECRTAELHAITRVNLWLPIQRKVVTAFGDQDVREQPWTRRAAIDWSAGRSRLHNAVARGTGFRKPPVTDHSPMPRHVVELLGNVLAKVTKCSATLRTARIVGLVNNVFAWQV
jgi:hypothetical protein